MNNLSLQHHTNLQLLEKRIFSWNISNWLKHLNSSKEVEQLFFQKSSKIKASIFLSEFLFREGGGVKVSEHCQSFAPNRNRSLMASNLAPTWWKTFHACLTSLGRHSCPNSLGNLACQPPPSPVLKEQKIWAVNEARNDERSALNRFLHSPDFRSVQILPNFDGGWMPALHTLPLRHLTTTRW